MGKVDDQRAMREARYAASNTGTAARRTTSAARPAKTADGRPARALRVVKPGSEPTTPAQTTAEPATDELCGHRNMGGKACTRERGHEATGTKNHRYG